MARQGRGRLRRRRYEWPAEGPRPGDAAGTGPRPRPRAGDVVWLALTAALVLVTVLQVGRLVWTIATDAQVQVTGGGAVLGFLVTIAWFLTIFWLAAGAWRRSVWGCPFTHTEDAHPDRRCQRHALVPAAAGARTDVSATEAPRVGAADEPGAPDPDRP